jgi:hypothetical protein
VPEPENAKKYLEDALKGQERGDMLPWAVRDLKSNAIVGTTRYHDIIAAADRVEIGYTWYAQRCQRTHVNTTCKLLLFEYGFEKLHCKVIGLAHRQFQLPLAARDRGARREEGRRDPPPLAAARRQHPRHGDVQRAGERVAGCEAAFAIPPEKK